jgi:hypothetical protein
MTVKFDKERHVQLDAISIEGNTVICNLYTGVYCAKISMSKSDYEYLIHKGFFIRDGKEADSADVLNTTDVYRLPIEEEGY